MFIRLVYLDYSLTFKSIQTSSVTMVFCLCVNNLFVFLVFVEIYVEVFNNKVRKSTSHDFPEFLFKVLKKRRL